MNKRDFMTKIAVRAMIAKGYLGLRAMHQNAKGAHRKNERLLFKILRRNQSCEYGQRYGFANIKSVEEFRQAVPVTTYADYIDDINRMIKNDETNILTSSKLVGYAQSSGSVGKRKFVPITQYEVDVYLKYAVTRMVALADRQKRRETGKGLHISRGMFLCPAYNDFLPNGLPCSNIADVVARQLGFIYPYILSFPDKRILDEQQADHYYVASRFALENKDTVALFAIFFKQYTHLMEFLKENWRTVVDDIETGEISDIAKAQPDVVDFLKSLVKPNPKRAAELREEFEKGFDETIIKRIWPNMSVICGIGTSTFAPFANAMRKYAAGVPFDFSVYAASEGIFAAVDELDSDPQLLLVDSCYYEFIPIDGDESTFLSLDELEIDKEYEIIITSQSGFYRYKCGDIIRVVDYLDECPYVVFSMRKGQLLNMTGEKTTEEQMTGAIDRLGEEVGCVLDEWCAYIDVETQPYHYTVLIENDKGLDLSVYSDALHKYLMEANPRYAYFFEHNCYAPLLIKNQQPGTHSLWDELVMKEKHVGDYQTKPVRVLDKPEKEEFFLARVVE